MRILADRTIPNPDVRFSRFRAILSNGGAVDCARKENAASGRGARHSLHLGVCRERAAGYQPTLRVRTKPSGPSGADISVLRTRDCVRGTQEFQAIWTKLGLEKMNSMAVWTLGGGDCAAVSG